MPREFLFIDSSRPQVYYEKFSKPKERHNNLPQWLVVITYTIILDVSNSYLIFYLNIHVNLLLSSPLLQLVCY